VVLHLLIRTLEIYSVFDHIALFVSRYAQPRHQSLPLLRWSAERKANPANRALYVNLLVVICGIAIAPGAGLMYGNAVDTADSSVHVDGAEEGMVRNEDSG